LQWAWNMLSSGEVSPDVLVQSGGLSILSENDYPM